MTAPTVRAGGRALRLADLAGTLVFAVEGGLRAAGAGLDVFGVLVLGLATAIGGGIVRDVLLGDVPPVALRSQVVLLVALGGGGVAFVLARAGVELSGDALALLDALGLSLFAVSGAGKALDHGAAPLTAMMLGTMSGIGGGTTRDVLLGEVPLVLRAEVYATAAVLGAALVVAGARIGARRATAALVGAAACFVLRMVSVWADWNLPAAQG